MERNELGRFLSALASDKPVPAGGSAAAAAVAMAAGLVEKAAKLSIAHSSSAANVSKRAAVLRRLSASLVEADATAYTDYVKAIRAAKGLHTAERERIIGPARARIIAVPLKIVRSAAEVVDLAAHLALHGNPNLRSDAIVAALLGAAAAESAATTLATNVKADPRHANLIEARLLTKTATASVGLLLAQARAGGRGRAPTRSRGSGPR